MSDKRINVLSKFVPLIISGDKDLTFRLKKEGETLMFITDTKLNTASDVGAIFSKNNKVKYKVGEVRQVVVDEKPVWYCPECNKEFGFEKDGEVFCDCKIQLKPFKIKILSIREQKLMDITNADAERSGFKKTKVYGKSPLGYTKPYYSAKENFTLEFCEIYGLTHKLIFANEWNPSVWRIEMEVIE